MDILYVNPTLLKVYLMRRLYGYISYLSYLFLCCETILWEFYETNHEWIVYMV